MRLTFAGMTKDSTKLNALLAERTRLANELRHARRDQFQIQHRIDELSIAIGGLTAMPSLDIGDIVPPALGLFAGLGGRRKRRRII